MIVEVFVKPNSRENKLEESNGFYVARVKSLPTEGRANDETIVLLSKYFKIPKSRISLKMGGRAKRKLFEIEDEQ